MKLVLAFRASLPSLLLLAAVGCGQSGDGQTLPPAGGTGGAAGTGGAVGTGGAAGTGGVAGSSGSGGVAGSDSGAPPPTSTGGSGGTMSMPPVDAGPETAPACQVDTDCRLFDDYCTGCDCRALGKGQPDPMCSGPGVRCAVEPCGGKTAACVAGHCQSADQNSTPPVMCGTATCPKGQTCCNPLCGLCAPPGSACAAACASSATR